MRGTEREREADTQGEGEAGSMRGAWCGTQSRVSRITPWAEGGAKRWATRAALAIMFYRRYSDLIHPRAESLYPFTNLSLFLLPHFPHPPSLETTFPLCFYEFDLNKRFHV